MKNSYCSGQSKEHGYHTCLPSVCTEESSTGTTASWLSSFLSGSSMNTGFSCSIHFWYTFTTFRVADTSEGGNKKAWNGKFTDFTPHRTQMWCTQSTHPTTHTAILSCKLQLPQWFQNLIVKLHLGRSPTSKAAAMASTKFSLWPAPHGVSHTHSPQKEKPRQWAAAGSDLAEHLVDEVDISTRGEEDALHHLIDAAVLLLHAAEAAAAEPPVWQAAAVGVPVLLLARRCRAIL